MKEASGNTFRSPVLPYEPVLNAIAGTLYFRWAESALFRLWFEPMVLERLFR